jgi:hypothetical protein
MRDIRDIIALLIIAHHLQCGCGIKDRFGQNAGKQQPDLIHRQSRRLILELDPQADQEVMRQRHEQ